MPPTKRDTEAAEVSAVEAPVEVLARSEDVVRAAEKRAAAAAGQDRGSAQLIDALLVERRGQVQRGGRDARVAAIDDQLRALGAEPPKDA